MSDPAAPAPPPALSPGLTALLAAGAGLSVASLYCNQPILAAMAQDLGVDAAAVGVVPTLTQLGYAAGLLLSAPLGDRLDRRAVITAKAAGLALALLWCARAGSLWSLGAASLAVGLLATLAQDFVPTAATLAPAHARGRVVGSVMTGLLLGILLSRLVSGVAGERLGWRAVYVGAAAAVGALGLVSWRALPTLAPTARDAYLALLASMAGLLARLPPLRRAALAQGLLSLAFSAFWSTLAIALAAPPFGLGSSVAGAFGLAGAAGAAIAPVSGALADRLGPEPVVRVSAALVAASFAAVALAPGSLAVLVAATVTFDLGIQAALIAHQTIVYGLEPAARSRVNAVLVGSMFLGMAAGSALASQVLARWGWRGVALLATAAALAALAVRLAPARAAAATRA